MQRRSWTCRRCSPESGRFSRRPPTEAAKARACTSTPLITKADGTEFGKTDGGAIWLDAKMTSPYDFYQFWLNAEDAKVADYLIIFTFRGRDEIAALEERTRDRPAQRDAQRALAEDVTALVHGEETMQRVRAAGQALVGTGNLPAPPNPALCVSG
ncbi:hypothetical protein K8O92_31100 [Nocardia asteroides]|nr:hypothetical protein K8O92_31100 [Nocardia asteroides]